MPIRPIAPLTGPKCTDDLVWPDPECSLVALMASLAEGLGGRAGPKAPLSALPVGEIQAHRQVVLLVLDGVGLDVVASRSPSGVFRKGLRTPLTSVFPSTTASGVTTLMTGLSPKEHGLVGWHVYFRELGAVLAVLPGKPRYGRGDWASSGVAVERLFGLSAFSDRIGVKSSVWVPEAIAESPVSRALRGRAEGLPHKGLSSALAQLASRLRANPGRAYHWVYDTLFDHVAHEKGLKSPEALEVLEGYEAALNDFLAEISASDTLVLVTADHGFIDSDPQQVIGLEDYPRVQAPLLLPLTGESRAAFAFVREGSGAAFEAAVAEELGDRIRLYRSRDLLEAGVFGEGPCHRQLQDRIGDYTLSPVGRGIIRDRLFEERRPRLVGVHGGISAAEMKVPLLVYSAASGA